LSYVNYVKKQRFDLKVLTRENVSTKAGI
jgi:hypothetical protein